jgi:hypothetical protein
MPVLPMDIVYHIFSFLSWRRRTQMISREYLKQALQPRRRRLCRWRSRTRIFSYMRVFGPAFVGYSWGSFCRLLDVRRRARNRHYTLTWRAAAEQYMRSYRCVGCGCRTRADVFGVHLCLRCRHNSRLVHAYMVMVCEAKARGVPSRILRCVRWHASMRCRLRFWHEIQEAVAADNDARV